MAKSRRILTQPNWPHLDGLHLIILVNCNKKRKGFSKQLPILKRIYHVSVLLLLLRVCWWLPKYTRIMSDRPSRLCTSDSHRSRHENHYYHPKHLKFLNTAAPLVTWLIKQIHTLPTRGSVIHTVIFCYESEFISKNIKQNRPMRYQMISDGSSDT